MCPPEIRKGIGLLSRGSQVRILQKLRETAEVTVEEIKDPKREGHIKTLSDALRQAPDLIRMFRNLKSLTPTQKSKGIGLVKARLIKERVFSE